MDEIRNKLYNIELVVNDIKKSPQTYSTILQNLEKDGTCQMILRRKFSNLLKEGVICKMVIPGTRFGKNLFFTLPKEYQILVESSRFGSDIYYFFKFKKTKFHIETEECWQLKENNWVRMFNKKFFNGDILKWL